MSADAALIIVIEDATFDWDGMPLVDGMPLRRELTAGEVRALIARIRKDAETIKRRDDALNDCIDALLYGSDYSEKNWVVMNARAAQKEPTE